MSASGYIGVELEESMPKHEKDTKELIAIGCDGKNGMVKLPNCQSESFDKQSMTNSTTGIYIDHDIPDGGKGINISQSIYMKLEKYNSLTSCLACNMDGCKTNTGCHSGAIRHLEIKLGRPLTWIICSLHCNEKVFHHLFEAIGEFFSNEKLCVCCHL